MTMVLPMRMTRRRLAEGAMPRMLPTMGGAKSPMTTKKAVQVPMRKPIILTSTHNLPAGPNVWKAF